MQIEEDAGPHVIMGWFFFVCVSFCDTHLARHWKFADSIFHAKKKEKLGCYNKTKTKTILLHSRAHLIILANEQAEDKTKRFALMMKRLMLTQKTISETIYKRWYRHESNKSQQSQTSSERETKLQRRQVEIDKERERRTKAPPR